VHRVERWIDTGQVPRDLVMGPDGLFFIANQMESSISVFQRNDARTYYRIGKVGTVDHPHRLAYNPVHRELWAASESSPRLAVYRLNGLRQPPLKQYVNLPIGAQTSAFALNSEGTKLWVADQAQPRLLEVLRDSDSYRVSEILSLPEGSRISDLKVVGGTLFALDEFQDKLYLINPASSKLETTIELQSSPTEKRPLLAERIAVNHAGSRLYLSASGTASVLVIDVQTKKLIQTLALDGSEVKFPAYAPLGLAVSQDDTRLYVTAQQGRNLALLQISATETGKDKVLSTMGTAVSEALLPPLGVIQMLESIP